MTPSPFTNTLAIEVATLQAQHPILADALGRAQAIVTDGRLFPEDDGRRAMVQSSDGAPVQSQSAPRGALQASAGLPPLPEGG